MKSKTDPKEFLKKYAPLLVLLVIFASALWLRALPARFSEIQALDPFFFYRMGQDLLHNNWQLGLDTMRYYPGGIDTLQYHYVMPIYLPPLVYAALGGLGMPFLYFAIMWPAWLGALSVIPMYFLGKELFGSWKAGAFSAFFLTTLPAFITRTSAGFYEKEPIAGLFIMLTVYFFVRSFRRSSWISGILGGISLAMISLDWGGVTYIYLLFAAFLGLVFAANLVLVALNYVFTGFDKTLKTLDRYMSLDMIKAYVPLMLIGILVQQPFARKIALDHISVIASFVMMGILLVRYGAERFKLVKKDYYPYVVPAMLVLIAASFLVGAMFNDRISGELVQLVNIVTFNKGVVSTTVAENAPGDWSNIASTTGTSFASSVVPQLNFMSPLFAVWVFMFAGIGLLVYRFWRTRDWMTLLPAVWLLSGIAGVFYYVRLVFLLGPPAALVSGFFAAWVLERAMRTKQFNVIRKVKNQAVPAVLAILFGLATVAVMLFAYGYIGIWSYAIALLLVTFFFIPIYQRLVFDKKGFDQSTIAGSVIAILLVVFTAFLVTVNMASAYSYSMNIGPSICFPKYNSDNLLDVEPCVTVDASGNDVMSSGQPWYEAMTFLADDTPENSSVLSWWDFGYWFQTRGDRPTVADGGHSGGAYRETDQEIADWYVDDYNNWGNYTDWLKERKVGYILMDYTLPGKYGAISKIASDGSTVVGMLQFTQKGVEPNGNDTVYVFANGQYEIWLPMNSQGSLSGTPMFLVSQNGQYVQRAYINDVCTTQGIVTIGSEDQFIPGCVAISDLGIFYIPPEAEHTIFTDLMFMNGVNSPVEKVFDNQLIKIYKLDI